MTEEEAYQVDCLLSILTPGWTATIARRRENDEQCWILKHWAFEWAWILSGCEFGEAYKQIVKILESWKWN